MVTIEIDLSILNNTKLNTNRFQEIKYGRLVGTDELGNKYYENNRYFVGRNRWVDYNQETWSAKWDYNASQVTPEW